MKGGLSHTKVPERLMHESKVPETRQDKRNHRIEVCMWRIYPLFLRPFHKNSASLFPGETDGF